MLELRPQIVASGQPAWSFDQAAERLATAVSVVSRLSGFAVHVPTHGVAPTSGALTKVVPTGRTILRAHLRSLILDRDSMHAHRDAARSRLHMTPAWLRVRVDHHTAPEGLVQRFAAKHKIMMVDEPYLDKLA
jgi:hypothetical protein